MSRSLGRLSPSILCGRGSLSIHTPTGCHLGREEGEVREALGMLTPRSHLQEEARLSELPEITVAVALARVMVRGPVFAAHVEDEWVANAGKKSIRAVRGCPGGACSPA